MSVNETKGYVKFKGKIWRLNNSKPYENEKVRTLSFGLQINKDNSQFLQIGEWKSTKLNVKYKASGMEEVKEVNEQVAIDEIKDNFKDGDSVFVNCRVAIDTYKKSIKLIVNQIYIENEEIKFDSEDFEETNSMIQSVVVIDKPSEKDVKVGLVNFNGQMIEQELKYADNEIKDYFTENIKVGDLLKLECQVIRKPKYVEVEGEQTARKTLKGKTVGEKKQTKDGYEEFIQIVDVDLDKTEKQKYSREEIRESLEKVLSTTKNNTNESSNIIDGDDLPY